MTKIVGFWRAPGVSLLDLAARLAHLPGQRVLRQAQRGEFAAACVGAEHEVALALDRPPVRSAVESDAPVLFMAGEVLGLGGQESFESLYARSARCDFLAGASGAFSGVLFDEARRRVLLFCDPLGLGQLYYRLDAAGLVFASEQKCLARLPERDTALEPQVAQDFLRHGHLVADSTWLRDVQLVKPGECVTLDLATGKSEAHRYFDLAQAQRPHYASYADAKRGIGEAYQAAFVRASVGVLQARVLLGGDVSSRMLLASCEARGISTEALTLAEVDSEEEFYARKACAVRGTLQRVQRPHGAGWLLDRARWGYMVEGVDLARLGQAALAPRAGSGHVFDAALGGLALGTRAIRGFDDLRAENLLRHARRSFAQTQVLGALTAQRFVFADAALWQAALGADVSYLLHERLHYELAQELFPDYFADLPIAHSAGRTLAQLLAKQPPRPPLPPHPLDPPPPPSPDPYAYLRADAETERFVWELLSEASALVPQYVDGKQAHAAYWAFYRGGHQASPAALLRYVSLEIWLRQLLRGEFVPSALPEPTRSAASMPPTLAPPSPESVPAVSVIVPAYNVEAYLGECLNSLINQELSEIEILVVDDGSSDGTIGVIERFAAADSRIRVLRTPNSGVYHARNRALELARGRYVAFVDADDYVHPAMFRLLLEAAEQRRAQVTFCDAFHFEGNQEPRIRRNTLRFKPNVPLSLATAPEMIGDGFSTLWNRLYDRAFLRKHDLKFDERYRISADMLFLQELLAKATTIVRVPRALYYYRFATPNSLTSYEVRNAAYLVHLQITIELIDFWVRSKLFERYAPFVLLRALRNFLWNTHIDEARLREVFQKFHAYLKGLRVGPVALTKLPLFERHVLVLLRAGDYAAFGRYVRRYRAKMIEAKGGELTRRERLSQGVDRLRARVRRSVTLERDEQAGAGRFRLTWPAAQLGLTLDRDTGLVAGAGAGALRAAPQKLAGVRDGLRALRRRVLFEGDLQKALSKAKPGARRVLHFSNVFSAPSETFTYDVITGLEQAAELDNYVMCFDRQLERERPFEKTITLLGATRTDLEALAPRAMSKIDLALDRLAPDLVHCHFGWVGIPLVLWLAQTQRARPVVITMHGTDVNMWPARHTFYADALKAMADKPWVFFTTHTHTYREKLERLGVLAAQIEVIPNSFDPRFVAGAELRHRFEIGEHLRVISVARMDIWKGHMYLIEGFASFVREHYANASLTLVGYGAEELKLRARVAELGLDDKVRFYGRATHQEVPVLLHNHDVYVQPSIKHPETLQEEGQPIAVLEAIASGMPVIVTETGGMAETVRVGQHEGHAFIVPDKSGPAIAAALAAVIQQPGSAARQRAYVAEISTKHARAQQLVRTRSVYERAWAAAGQAGAAMVTTGREAT